MSRVRDRRAVYTEAERRLYSRAKRIRQAIIDGDVEPLDGFTLIICPTPELLRQERAAEREAAEASS